MKMNKSQLKEIIKECLVEILTEGLGADVTATRQSSMQTFEARQSRQQFMGLGHKKSPESKISSRLDERPSRVDWDNVVKSSSGGDPILESILADTAKTTLVQQTSAGDSITSMNSVRPAGLSQQEQFSGDPEHVFGQEASSKWAELAFASPINKKFT